jgi:hypothetical protein
MFGGGLPFFFFAFNKSNTKDVTSGEGTDYLPVHLSSLPPLVFSRLRVANSLVLRTIFIMLYFVLLAVIRLPGSGHNLRIFNFF